ncbi:hypothetical protein KY319_01880 [Candidatus Woesearchaeota archaeon]|nr:hypothetical protein [Candidatus Woesearchaeota archaeon]
MGGVGDLEKALNSLDSELVSYFLAKNPAPVYDVSFLESVAEFVSRSVKTAGYTKGVIQTALNYCMRAIEHKMASAGLREHYVLCRQLFINGSHLCMGLVDISESLTEKVLNYQAAYQFNRAAILGTFSPEKLTRQYSYKSRIAYFIGYELKEVYREIAAVWMNRSAIDRRKGARIAEKFKQEKTPSLYFSAANRKYDAFLLCDDFNKRLRFLDDAVALMHKAESLVGSGFRLARYQLNLAKFYFEKHNLTHDEVDRGFTVHYYRKTNEFVSNSDDPWCQKIGASIKKTLKVFDKESQKVKKKSRNKPKFKRRKRSNDRKFVDEGLDEFYST